MRNSNFGGDLTLRPELKRSQQDASNQFIQGLNVCIKMQTISSKSTHKCIGPDSLNGRMPASGTGRAQFDSRSGHIKD